MKEKNLDIVIYILLVLAVALIAAVGPRARKMQWNPIEHLIEVEGGR